MVPQLARTQQVVPGEKCEARVLVRGGLPLEGVTAAPATRAHNAGHVSAIAFDGFPIIDARLVVSRCIDVFGSHGEALAAAWRARQFDYTWLRTLAGQ